MNNMSMVGGMSQITRAANCNEMSASTLDAIGLIQTGALQGRQSAIDNNDEATQKKYDNKFNALRDVTVKTGIDPKTNKNHMWVQIGHNNDDDAVVADAWGKGGAVNAKNYSGSRIFSHDQRQRPTGAQELMSHSTNIDKVRKDTNVKTKMQERINSNKTGIYYAPPPTQAQHHNHQGDQRQQHAQSYTVQNQLNDLGKIFNKN